MKHFLKFLPVIAILIAGCTRSGPAPIGPKPATAAAPAPPSQGFWQVEHSTNPVTGEVTTIAGLVYQGDQQLIIRRVGKKLELYITTGKFLETVDNVDSRASTVQYKIGTGKVIRQLWSIGADNETLFYPGSPVAMLEQIRSATSLSFEFRPADEVPQTVTFDVTGLPNVFDLPPATEWEKRERDIARKDKLEAACSIWSSFPEQYANCLKGKPVP